MSDEDLKVRQKEEVNRLIADITGDDEASQEAVN
jgi:hypothetical protein